MGNEDQALTTHPRIIKGSTLITRKKNNTTRIRGITLEEPGEIYLMSDDILVMRTDIIP